MTHPTSSAEAAPTPRHAALDSALWIALFTAIGYLLGFIFLRSFYAKYGLSLRSLDLPTSEYLLASLISTSHLCVFGFGIPALALSLLPAKIMDSRAGLVPLLILGMGASAVLYFVIGHKWLAITVPFAIPSVWCYFRSHSLRPNTAWVVWITLWLFYLTFSLAKTSVEPDGIGLRNFVVLYTTPELKWAHDGKPLHLILHRGGYWYVRDPDDPKSTAHMIPDSAVLRAEPFTHKD